MNMTIEVTGTQPKPRVINVKQNSAGVDEISFKISGLSAFTAKAALSVRSDTYKQELSGSISGGELLAVWSIPLEFTKKSGCIDIQLELTEDSRTWKSDKLVLIVSESVSGEVLPDAGSGGYGAVGNCIGYLDGIVDEGVIGDYTDLS